MNPEEYLESLGISLKATALISCIDGVMKNPDLCKIMKDYSDLKAKELELRILPSGGLGEPIES